MQQLDQDESLWQFASAYWCDEEVERKAIWLQDQFQISVCLLLTLLWCLRLRVPLDKTVVTRLRDLSMQEERSHIGPLRQQRRNLDKTACKDQWRESMAEELEAEKSLLARLDRIVMQYRCESADNARSQLQGPEPLFVHAFPECSQDASFMKVLRQLAEKV